MKQARELVLVADDDPDVLRLIEVNLGFEGYDVLTARSGDETLTLARMHKPDIVLLDVAMPGMSGIEVCAALKGDHRTRHIPVVMVTASTASPDKMLALTAGADDYLTKPFNSLELIARVHTTIARARRMRETAPLTGLPGNVAIEEDLDRRIAMEVPFALLYIDLDHFKAFNDRYGFIRGDTALKTLALSISQAVEEIDAERAFVGHIGGDDFVAIVPPGHAEPVARSIIAKWEAGKVGLYDPADARRGFIETRDRSRNLRRYELLTVSIGIATTTRRHLYSRLEAARIATELKMHAKTQPGSLYVIDRRSAPPPPPEPVGRVPAPA